MYVLSFILIICISIEIRLPVMTYFLDDLHYSYYFSLVSTFSVVWLPLTILFSILFQYIHLASVSANSHLLRILCDIDYTRWINDISAKRFLVGLFFLTGGFLIKITFILIWSYMWIIKDMLSNLNIKDAVAFWELSINRLNNYKVLNFKSRMPSIYNRLSSLNEYSNKRLLPKLLGSGYYRSKFQPFTLPQVCPSIA